MIHPRAEENRICLHVELLTSLTTHGYLQVIIQRYTSQSPHSISPSIIPPLLMVPSALLKDPRQRADSHACLLPVPHLLPVVTRFCYPSSKTDLESNPFSLPPLLPVKSRSASPLTRITAVSWHGSCNPSTPQKHPDRAFQNVNFTTSLSPDSPLPSERQSRFTPHLTQWITSWDDVSTWLPIQHSTFLLPYTAPSHSLLGSCNSPASCHYHMLSPWSCPLPALYSLPQSFHTAL